MTALYTIRPSTPDDAKAIADIYLTSRKLFLPYAPLSHTDDEVRHWVASHLLKTADVYVADVESAVVGFLALQKSENGNWLEQLYLHPDHVGLGIGTEFLLLAQRDLPAPIRLYTFQANDGARRFYERHGFRPIAFGDGSGNEEKCPDVLYEWEGAKGSLRH